MEFDCKQLDIVTRLRKTYLSSDDAAFDALLYYLLSDEGKNVADIETKVKRAISFCESVEAEDYYRQVYNHVSSRCNHKKDHVDVDNVDGDESIYTFSRERAKAAKR
jgi:hypothetical protein